MPKFKVKVFQSMTRWVEVEMEGESEAAIRRHLEDPDADVDFPSFFDDLSKVEVDEVDEWVGDFEPVVEGIDNPPSVV